MQICRLEGEKEMREMAKDEEIKEAVRDAYGGIARRVAWAPASSQPVGCCGSAQEASTQAGCCGSSQEAPVRTSCCDPSAPVETGPAARFYSEAELEGLPDTVTGASLGCGNPLAIAELQPGEVVLDLGSGGGIDCFLAARKVGPEGRVIGLDMTPDMIKLARRNARKMGVTNVDFRYGEMEEMPLSDGTVDVIISNCVVNLSPDKDAVFREAYRVLRPGGHLSISDIVVDGNLPQFIRSQLDAWAGCVAGALDEAVYLDKIRAAGFERVDVQSRDQTELDETTGWDEVQAILSGDDGRDAMEHLAQEGLRSTASSAVTPADVASKIASIKVTAYKPA
jgi:SAM-dependent methyltransferase